MSPLTGDREFESISLQQRDTRELTTDVTDVFRVFSRLDLTTIGVAVRLFLGAEPYQRIKDRLRCVGVLCHVLPYLYTNHMNR